MSKRKPCLVIIFLACLLNPLESQAPDLEDAARAAAGWHLPAEAPVSSATGILAASTALGCELIPGLPLPDPLMVTRFEFARPDASFAVHVTADGALAQVCDERFSSLGNGVQPAPRDLADSDGDGIRDSADACPQVAGSFSAERSGCPQPSRADKDGDGTTDARDRCPAQAGAAAADGCSLMRDADGDGAPDHADLCPAQVGVIEVDFALGCPRDGSGKSSQARELGDLCQIIGTDMPVYASPDAGVGVSAHVNSATVLGISAALDWLQARDGWLKAEGGRLHGACFNIPLVHPPPDFSGCYMRPGGNFVNIRQAPHGKLVARLQRQEQVAVLGMNADGSWLFFREGWASRSALELTGDCALLPILNPARAASGVLRFCPPDYAGFLPPRIKPGLANARVVSGEYNNRLRAAPEYAAELIGEIPAGSLIDAVLDGPACQAPYVWWQVRSGESVGWTVESDIKAYHYYLAPVEADSADGDSAFIALSQETAAAHRLIHSANIASPQVLAGLSIPAPVDVAWSARGERLAVLSERGEVRLFSGPDFAQPGQTLDFGGSVSAMAWSPDGDWLALGDSDGSIRLLDLAALSMLGLGDLAGPVHGLAWSGMGDNLGAISGDEALKLARRAGMLKLWRIDRAEPEASDLLAHYHTPYPLTALAFSFDGQWLAVSGESRSPGRAALWIVASGSGELAYSKALIPSDGQAMVIAAPAADLGDFVYSSGDSLWALDLGGADRRFYHQAGAIVTSAAFRRQSLPGAESLLALAALSPNGERRLSIVNALNPHSPRADFALAPAGLAFSPDGRSLAIAEPSGDRVIVLGAGGE